MAASMELVPFSVLPEMFPKPGPLKTKAFHHSVRPQNGLLTPQETNPRNKETLDTDNTAKSCVSKGCVWDQRYGSAVEHLPLHVYGALALSTSTAPKPNNKNHCLLQLYYLCEVPAFWTIILHTAILDFFSKDTN